MNIDRYINIFVFKLNVSTFLSDVSLSIDELKMSSVASKWIQNEFKSFFEGRLSIHASLSEEMAVFFK